MLNEHADRLARIETGIEHILSKIDDSTKIFTKKLDDHEDRIRKVESDMAKKSDVLKVHKRVDQVVESAWKMRLALVVIAFSAGGGAATAAKAFF